jgi:putative drug exporter of the RND superfamily
VLARDFSGGLTSPAQVVVDGDVRSPAVSAAVGRLRAALAADRAFGPSVVQAGRAGDLALVSVPINGDPNGQAATAAVRHLRQVTVPDAFAGVDARVLVGGETAGGIDFFDLSQFYTPLGIALVLGLSFLLLLVVVFRSVVLPLLGVALNLLSAGAAYGLLVLVFQHGIGASLFGLQQVDTIQAWLPLFCSRCCSGCPWTTRCLCSAASRSATAAPATTTRRWRLGCAPPAGSSPAPR